MQQFKKAGIRATIRAYADDFAIVLRSASAALRAIRTLFTDLTAISNLSSTQPVPSAYRSGPCLSLRTAKAYDHLSGMEPDRRLNQRKLSRVPHGSRQRRQGTASSRQQNAAASSCLGLVHHRSILFYCYLQHLHLILGLLYRTTRLYQTGFFCAGNRRLGPGSAKTHVTEAPAHRGLCATKDYPWNIPVEHMPDDLRGLRDHFGQAASFRGFENTAYAAKVRVAQDIREQMPRRPPGQGASTSSTPPHMLTDRTYGGPWVKASPLLILQDARQYVDHKRLHTSVVRQTIGGNSGQPWSPAVLRRIRNCFQSTIAAKLRQLKGYSPHHRMRHKLERWRLPGRPATTQMPTGSCGASEHSNHLYPGGSQLHFSAHFGWGIKGHFQREGYSYVLGCPPDANDSIKHYACCPIIRDAAGQHLRIRLWGWPYALKDFLMATGPPSAPHPTEDNLTTSALLVYAAYVHSHHCRSTSPTGQHWREQGNVTPVASRGRPGQSDCNPYSSANLALVLLSSFLPALSSASPLSLPFLCLHALLPQSMPLCYRGHFFGWGPFIDLVGCV